MRLAERGLKRAFQQNAFFAELTVLENMVAVLQDARTARASLASVLLPLGARCAAARGALEADAAAPAARFGVPAAYHASSSPADIPYGTQRMLSIALAYGSGAQGADAGRAGRRPRRRGHAAPASTCSAALKAGGAALVVIEHHMDLIMSVADRIVVLDAGRLLATGTPREIQADPRVLEAYLGRAAMSARRFSKPPGSASPTAATWRSTCRTSRSAAGRAGGRRRRQRRRQVHPRERPARLVARRAARVRRGPCWTGEDMSGLPTHARVRRGLLLVPEGGAVFAQLDASRRTWPRPRRPPIRPAGRHSYSIDEVYALFPRLCERLAPRGSAALGRRAADARPSRGRCASGRARCCWTSPPSASRRGWCSSVLGTVRRLVDAGPAGAAGGAERARRHRGGGPAGAAGARPRPRRRARRRDARRPAHRRGLSGSARRMNLAAAAHQRARPGPRLRADRHRLDGAAGRGAAGELRPRPDVHARRLRGLVGDGAGSACPISVAILVAVGGRPRCSGCWCRR